VFVLFAFLDTKSIPLIIIALLGDGMLQDLQYGPQAAIIAENFPASRRYTGSGLGYHLAAITAGGPAPVIAAALFATYQTSTAISLFALATTLVSLVTLRFLKDKAGMLDQG
jgi:sugar phosphate permease